MKKTIISVSLILMSLIIFLGSCEAKSNDGTSANYNNKQAAEAAGDGYQYSAEKGSEYDSVTDENGAPTDTDNTAAPKNFPKKLIKTAAVVIEAKDVSAAYNAILDFAKQNGGYEFKQTTTKNEASNEVVATIKIPPEHLDKLLSFAGTKGELLRSQVDSDDITDSYYDSKIRLDSLNAQLEKYREFLKDTKSVDDMIRVQNQIDSLTTEIEVLEGRLKKYDSQVAESTVNFVITQKADPSLRRREINWNTLSLGDMWYLISSGTVTVVNIVISVLQWVAIILIVSSPLWIITLVILYVVFRKKLKARKERKAHKEAETQE